MIVTMLEARLAARQGKALLERFQAAGEALPPFIRESFLLQAVDDDVPGRRCRAGAGDLRGGRPSRPGVS